MNEYYEQGVPTTEDAQLLLKKAEKLFPGQWVQHSVYTAQAAKLIADNCEELNPEVTYVLGLLHDIGRRNGFTLIEKRLVDVALRHGVNEHIVPKWKAFIV